jgi:hypothetical protein
VHIYSLGLLQVSCWLRVLLWLVVAAFLSGLKKGLFVLERFVFCFVLSLLFWLCFGFACFSSLLLNACWS